MRIFRNSAPPNERFLIDVSFDELREVNAVIRQTAGHLCSDELAAKFDREIDGLFQPAAPSASVPVAYVPSAPVPLVSTGQGSYRRDYPPLTAELLGGDPDQAVSEATENAITPIPVDLLA